jgi:hypothetical protein
MIDTSPFRNINPGLYTVYWKSGGSSLAAVGVRANGGRWLAPINWTSPTDATEEPPWLDVLRMEPVDIRGPKAGGFSMFYSLVGRDPDGDVSVSFGSMSESLVVLVAGVPKVSVQYLTDTARYRVLRCGVEQVFAHESGALARVKELLLLDKKVHQHLRDRAVCHDGTVARGT